MTLAGARVGVIGGGVAGLTFALAAARRGADVTVFEQAPALGDVGAGLQLSANALRVLSALGLDPGAAPGAHRPEVLHLRDLASGREILRTRLARPGRPYLQMHRADLVGWLAEACAGAGITLRLGRSVAPDELSDFVHVVRASGVRSAERPGLAPVFSGQVAWRALVPGERAGAFAAGGAEVFLAPGRHLVVYPLRGGAVVNLVGVTEGGSWDREGWHHRAEPEAFRAAFAPACGRVGALLKGVEQVVRWGLFIHPDIAMLDSSGRPLVGDAAQTMLPFMAQGAAMAVEDAFVLARVLDEDRPLSEYARLRSARRALVSRLAEANGRIFHEARPWVLPFLRAGMRATGVLWPGFFERRTALVHDFDVTA